MRGKVWPIIFIGLFILLIHPKASFASYSGQYTITSADTPATIDQTNTTATVDTTNYEITLPKQILPNQIAAWNGGKDIIALTNGKVVHFSFTGSNYQENTVLDIGAPSNSLALAAPDPFPDVVVSSPDELHHYSFTGSGLEENPYLAVQGLANAVAVGVSKNDVAGIVNGKIKHYSFSGTSMAENAYLEPTTTFTNPVDLALFPDNNDLAVLTQTKLYYYNYNGSSLVENPALEVTGLQNAQGMSYTDQNGGHEVAIIEGTQVKDYIFTGSSMQYNAALSVTSGLTAPSSVVIVPGTEDRIIVDGDQLKYYQWNGSSLVYNSAMSLTVNNLVLPGYASKAQVQSQIFNSGENDDVMRVLAYINAPASTEVDISGTVDGTTWIKLYKVIGNSSGGEFYVTSDNGSTWQDIGSASSCFPGSSNINLWVNMPTGISGSKIAWQFSLSTSDPQASPVIQVQAPGTPGSSPAITWDADIAPTQPVVVSQGTCYDTASPSIEWNPEVQSTWSFRVWVYTQNTNTLAYDSGVLPFTSLSSTSPNDTYIIPTSTDPAIPGPLWASGTWQFYAVVQVYNDQGIPSKLSTQDDFCVVAFERPRIDKIVSPSTGQTAPDPNNQSTWILVSPGESSSSLPSTRAGGDVQMAVDYIGPADPSVNAVFPYPEPGPVNQASVLTGEPVSALTINNFGNGTYDGYQWTNGTNTVFVADCWTNPSTSVTPDGTIVGMDWSSTTSAGGTSLDSPTWSDGLFITNGSVYSDYLVVLNPSNGR